MTPEEEEQFLSRAADIMAGINEDNMSKMVAFGFVAIVQTSPAEGIEPFTQVRVMGAPATPLELTRIFAQAITTVTRPGAMPWEINPEVCKETSHDQYGMTNCTECERH